MTTHSDQKPALSYKDAGVDIDKGDALVSAIKPHAARTSRPGSNPDLGGFGGLFDLKAAGFKDPVLVAATDGVGTKLELAKACNIHRGLGIDLVAMCVNDLLAQGAEPLFFLDYFATGKLASEVATEVIAGIADGCVEAGCALIGGETAEMPGVYPAGGYDLAGFSVGAAERNALLKTGDVSSGDIVLALPSSGIHSNGFSLVRKIIEVTGADIHKPFALAPHISLGEALLTPTRIYADAVKAGLNAGGITSISHITGGGLIENPPRVFGDDLAITLDMALRPFPPLFRWLKQAGNLSDFEMARTFNCGIGMLITVRADAADSVEKAMLMTGEDVWQIGQIGARSDDAVTLLNCSSAWA
jgi:phosphoribosylformylglycinamidine cyclo-ligase